MRRPACLAVAGLATLVLAGCGGGDKSDEDTSSQAATSTPAATTATPDATPTDTTAAGAGTCRTVATPKARDGKTKKPTGTLPAGSTVTLDTSCGDITIELATKDDPKTANNFGRLAGRGYYDGLGFHRVVPGFVIQGGDPAGDGSGGPGYTVVEAPPSDTTYDRGVVAMAKTGTDPAGASGSQFFIVTTDAQLPAEYAIAGRVTKGMDVADAISALGTGDGPPTQPVVIEKATLKRG